MVCFGWGSTSHRLPTLGPWGSIFPSFLSTAPACEKLPSVERRKVPSCIQAGFFTPRSLAPVE